MEKIERLLHKMRFLLLMTLSGSILFIGYFCWEGLFGYHVTQSIKYKILITILFVYIIPWAWLKDIYKYLLGLFWIEGIVENMEGKVNIAEIRVGQELYKTIDYWLVMLFVLTWFTVAAFLVLIKSIKYLRRRRAFRLLAIDCRNENLEEVIECLRKEIHCWCKPQVVWTRVDNETFTLGGIRPIIFLQKEYTTEELYLVLKHEMIHITRLDMLIKLVQEFVCCLHWFNPFVYMLMHKIAFTCETSCDEKVLEGGSEENRKKYIELLDKSKRHNRLKNNDIEIDKRIELIQKKRKAKYYEKGVAVSVFALLLFMDSLIALAYPKVRHVENAQTSSAKELVAGGIFWGNDSTADGYNTSISTVLYEEQFITETGSISPIYPEDSSNLCEIHEIESGYYQIHRKNDDNSCVVEIYEGTRCANCGKTWIDKPYQTINYDICIH